MGPLFFSFLFPCEPLPLSSLPPALAPSLVSYEQNGGDRALLAPPRRMPRGCRPDASHFAEGGSGGAPSRATQPVIGVFLVRCWVRPVGAIPEREDHACAPASQSGPRLVLPMPPLALQLTRFEQALRRGVLPPSRVPGRPERITYKGAQFLPRAPRPLPVSGLPLVPRRRPDPVFFSSFFFLFFFFLFCFSTVQNARGFLIT